MERKPKPAEVRGVFFRVRAWGATLNQAADAAEPRARPATTGSSHPEACCHGGQNGVRPCDSRWRSATPSLAVSPAQQWRERLPRGARRPAGHRPHGAAPRGHAAQRPSAAQARARVGKRRAARHHRCRSPGSAPTGYAVRAEILRVFPVAPGTGRTLMRTSASRPRLSVFVAVRATRWRVPWLAA